MGSPRLALPSMPACAVFVHRAALLFIRSVQYSSDFYATVFFTMLSLPGPTPIHSTGTPRNVSMNSMYFWQLAGKASYEVTSAMLVFQPGRVT